MINFVIDNRVVYFAIEINILIPIRLKVSYKLKYYILRAKQYYSIKCYLVALTLSSSWSTVGFKRPSKPSAKVSLVGLSHKLPVFSSADVVVLSVSSIS